MDIEKLCITGEYTLIETIDAIKASKHRGVVVLSEEGKVCGFVSQGDILEALLDKVSLYAKVSSIIKPSFLYTYERDLKKVYPLFRKKVITVLPVVDKEFNLKGMITLEDILDHAEIIEK